MPDIEAHGLKNQKHQEIGDNMNKRTRPRQALPAKQIEDKNNSESEDSSDCFDDTHDSGVIDYNPDQVPNETSKYWFCFLLGFFLTNNYYIVTVTEPTPAEIENTFKNIKNMLFDSTEDVINAQIGSNLKDDVKNSIGRYIHGTDVNKHIQQVISE